MTPHLVAAHLMALTAVDFDTPLQANFANFLPLALSVALPSRMSTIALTGHSSLSPEACNVISAPEWVLSVGHLMVIALGCFWLPPTHLVNSSSHSKMYPSCSAWSLPQTSPPRSRKKKLI